MFLIIILLILGTADVLVGFAYPFFCKKPDAPITGGFLMLFGSIVVMMTGLFYNIYTGGQ